MNDWGDASRLEPGWKREYIKWYRIAEEVMEGAIPSLNEDEIVNFVSQNNWLIIPTSYEKDRQESITRSDPNIYFDLSEEGRIHIGFACNTLESVRRIGNILHGLHTVEKTDLIRELRKLDARFKTSVERKIKEHHFAQTPEYRIDFEFDTNMIDDNLLSQAFERIDAIMRESDKMMSTEGKSWRTLAPVLNLAHTVIDRDENNFGEVLRRLRPAYQIALHIKTGEEIEREIREREKKKTEERQRRYREFVVSLIEKGIGGKEYREAIAKWERENPWTEGS